jgi:sulfur dioxygenase
VLFRQLIDGRSSTYTYLLADAATRDAVLIDPVFEQEARDAALLRELGLTLRYTLDTHVHADHVTAAWLFRERAGTAIVVSADAGVEGADRLVREGDVITFGGETLSVLATPGHTGGCVSYVTGDRGAVFTGDALLIRGAGRTDFQQGDAHRLYR